MHQVWQDLHERLSRGREKMESDGRWDAVKLKYISIETASSWAFICGIQNRRQSIDRVVAFYDDAFYRDKICAVNNISVSLSFSLNSMLFLEICTDRILTFEKIGMKMRSERFWKCIVN